MTADLTLSSWGFCQPAKLLALPKSAFKIAPFAASSWAKPLPISRPAPTVHMPTIQPRVHRRPYLELTLDYSLICFKLSKAHCQPVEITCDLSCFEGVDKAEGAQSHLPRHSRH